VQHIPGQKDFKDSSWFGKPYYFFGDYLWNKYETRVLKLPINVNLGCPNRDGTTGDEGCIFCPEDGSAAPISNDTDSILKQMKLSRNSFARSPRDTRYIAYFQAFTNTYAPVEHLKTIYDMAIAPDDIIGLMIGTRPDCLPDEILDLIATYRKDMFELWLEIGMQTIHDSSLNYLFRGHNYDQTRDSIVRAAKRNIPVCVHVILGIPGESWRDMMDTAEEISSLPVSGVKLHHLHAIRGTRLGDHYIQDQFVPITFHRYVSYVCDFIERLRPDITIHRLSGDRDPASLLAPSWSLHKGTVIKAIQDEFQHRQTFQGFLFRD